MPNNCVKTRKKSEIPSIASRAEATLLSAILEYFDHLFGQRHPFH